MVGMGAEKLEVASEGGHERKFEVALTVVCGFAETKEGLTSRIQSLMWEERVMLSPKLR
jgi:hypothetical protein